MDLNPENMRAEFWKLTDEREAILARSSPVRAKRDQIVNAARAKETELNAQIQEIEDGLFELENKRGMLVRALNRQTGERPGTATPAAAEGTGPVE